MILPENRCGQGPPGAHDRPGGHPSLRAGRLRRGAGAPWPGPSPRAWPGNA